MRQILISTLLVFGFYGSIWAQTVLIEEHVDSIQPLKTKESGNYFNQASFFAYKMAFGVAIDPLEIAERTGTAWNWGFFYKQKVTNVLSFVSDARFSSFSNNYSLLEDNIQELDFAYRRSKWLIGELGIGPRINFDPNRGDKMGLYLTSEGYVGYVLDNRIKERYALAGPGGERQTSRIVGFETNSKWTYGISFTLGYEQHALNVQYRLSELTGSSNAGILQGYESMSASPLLITYQLGFF